MTIETLARPTLGLGVKDLTYLLDPDVFDHVNRQIQVVAELRRMEAKTVALRSHPRSQVSPGSEVAQLLSTLGDQVQQVLHETVSQRRVGHDHSDTP